jgi:hypothetical protein
MYMNEFIVERKEEFRSDPDRNARRSDLLTNLIAASAEDEEGDGSIQSASSGRKHLSLSETELRGYAFLSLLDPSLLNVQLYSNIFIYLIAGHEVQ